MSFGRKPIFLALIATAALISVDRVQAKTAARDARPNIVLVIADDLGSGDLLSATNPLSQFAALSRIAEQGTRLRNFHVDPTCSPTRAALLTGQYSLRTGVWHTIMGRSTLPTDHRTLAEMLRAAGYDTGLFGKWHLGDSYPFRPQDRGFNRVVALGGGGVGQTPDVWGNDQFDDQYFVDGRSTRFKGYATNVWFDSATAFVAKPRKRPFFAYIAPNAAHMPWRAPTHYVDRYTAMGLPKPVAQFYAMIAAFDDGLAKLDRTLKARGLSDNTIFIVTSDNGSALSERSLHFGPGGFARFKASLGTGHPLRNWTLNDGLSGSKAEVLEGGHRVPFVIRWPRGRLQQNATSDVLAAHIDVVPTLLAAAGQRPDRSFDGTNLLPWLRGRASVQSGPDRMLFVTNQRVDVPRSSRPMVAMWGPWRYVVATEGDAGALYNLENDPGQRRNLAPSSPELVAKAQRAYSEWWLRMAPDPKLWARPVIGNIRENPVRLTAMDWTGATSDNAIPWWPGFPYAADVISEHGWLGRESEFKPRPWAVRVERPGTYRVSLYMHDKVARTPVGAVRAVLTLGQRRVEVATDRSAPSATVEVALASGNLAISGLFERGDGTTVPAYYVYVEGPLRRRATKGAQIR